MLRRAKPYVPALVVSSALAAVCIFAILERAGRPAAPLDDTFIHLQYARRLSEGGFMSYVPGGGYTSGATSFAWPMLLAPFHLIGARGLNLLVLTWFFGTLFHAALATETARVARPLTSPAAAAGAGAMCLFFGAFAWFAWSGMETIAFAWALMRTLRLASEWMESGGERTPRPRTRGSGTPPSVRSLLMMALLAPLLRPEGAIASLLVAIALAVRPAPGAGPSRSVAAWASSRAPAALSLVGPAVIPIVHWLATGEASSSTTTVKWLVTNPYYVGATLTAAVRGNVSLLVTDILSGGKWGAIFVPEGLHVALGAGVVALGLGAARTRLHWRVAFVVIVALATFVPCTYLSFLWNRVRYVWPFAGAWFVLLACLCEEVGRGVRRLRPRWTFVTPLCAGLFVGALATKLPWTTRDLAESAHAIDRQQVALGEWARGALPADALIGVNDTGAIAYMSDHATFDVVGLTTRGEARYWVAGPGSRYEHYERLGEDALPTHFIVYDGWMAMPVVLGRRLHEATVTDQSILGGVTKTAYEADWSVLGRGALPATPPSGAALVDELDVSDLESEATHAYQLFQTNETKNLVGMTFDDRGEAKADGGRYGRVAESFVLHLTPARATSVVIRLAAGEPTEVVVSSGGHPVHTLEVPASPWFEGTITLPEEVVEAETEVRLEVTSTERPFAALHYWAYQPES